MGNLLVVCHACHAQMRSPPTDYDFVLLLAELLEDHEDFRFVGIEATVRTDKSVQVDLSVQERSEQGWRQLYIECKAYSALNSSLFSGVREQLLRLEDLIEHDAQLVFALRGRLSGQQKRELEARGIEIWDLGYIATRFGSQLPEDDQRLATLLGHGSLKLDGSQQQDLIRELDSCASGRAAWSAYQRLVRRILELLFCPPLSHPRPELWDAAKVNRRDLVFPNYAEGGFWRFVRERASADYVVVDAKNHSAKVRKQAVTQLCNYLKSYGPGLFGIIVCRHGPGRSALWTAKEQWITYGKLVVFLDDDDLRAMLLAHASGGTAEEIVGQKIETFRLWL